MRVAKTLIFVCFVGPGPLIGLVPWMFSGWKFHVANVPVQCLGALLVLLGAIPLADSIRRFVKEGNGTPAPYAETQSLVVSGFYCYVRNPMYLGVLAMISGQALLLWNAGILIYTLVAALGFHVFVTLYEEPRLRAKYGEAYADYQRHVHRWLPRFDKA